MSLHSIVPLSFLRLIPADGACVLVTGGFDPLHYGHIRCIRHAAALAVHGTLMSRMRDLVVVGVAPDSYVAQRHPVLQTLDARCEMMSAINGVDYVTPQDGDTASGIIRACRPRLFVKGESWRGRLPRDETEALTDVGGEVVYVPVGDTSSSGLLRDFFWRLADEMGRH